MSVWKGIVEATTPVVKAAAGTVVSGFAFSAGSRLFKAAYDHFDPESDKNKKKSTKDLDPDLAEVFDDDVDEGVEKRRRF